jgi:hypothetical protein
VRKLASRVTKAVSRFATLFDSPPSEVEVEMELDNDVASDADIGTVVLRIDAFVAFLLVALRKGPGVLCDRWDKTLPDDKRMKSLDSTMLTLPPAIWCFGLLFSESSEYEASE